MISALARLTLTTALLCAGTAGATAVGAPAPVDLTGGWDPPVTLAEEGLTADLAVSATGDMTVAVLNDGDLELVQRAVGGAWTPPETLVDHGRVAAAQVAYDAAGLPVVAWADTNLSEQARIVVRRGLAGGGWSARAVVALRDNGSFYFLDLDVNAGGDGLLGWSWLAPGRQPRLLVARGAAAGTWDPPSRWDGVNEQVVALGDNGSAAVMMEVWGGESDPTLALKVVRQVLGEPWGTPKTMTTVSSEVPFVGIGGVAVDAQGFTIASWRQEPVPNQWEVVASRARQGGAWGPVTVLAPSAGFSEYPIRVMATPEGAALVAWTRAYSSVRAALRPAGGDWLGPVTVTLGEGLVVGWDAAMDPTGRAVVVSARAPSFSTLGYGIDARLMNRAGVWGVPTRLTTVTENFPWAEMGHGDALAVWRGARIRASTHLAP